MHNERLTLATICGGAVQEKVDRALERVAKNILDPNTDPVKKRSITLKITFRPSEDDNEDVEVSADVSAVLAPELGVTTRFFVSKDLDTEAVTVMEHRKGEIKGQLDFSDFGMDMNPQPSDEVEEAEEVTAEETVHEVLDFRRNRG